MSDPLEPHKQSEIDSKRAFLETDPHVFRKPFGPEWSSHDWVKWATIQEVIHRLGVPVGSRLLDVGCGNGWLAILLAQAGYRTKGFDIAPVFVERARQWAAEWGVPAEFEAADMDQFASRDPFDGVIVFDSLHHSTRQAAVIRNVAASLRPGGWVLFGEPSWLHAISPDARRVQRELGWIERGITVRSLKRDCRAAGLGGFRRFFEGTRPYEGRIREAAWQAVRLLAANVAVAPSTSIWLLARKR